MKYLDHELWRCCGRVAGDVTQLGGFWLARQQSGSASDVSAVRKTKQMELRMVSVQNRLVYLLTSIGQYHCVKIIKYLINYPFRRHFTSCVCSVWGDSEPPSSRVYCYVTWSVQTAQPPPAIVHLCWCSAPSKSRSVRVPTMFWVLSCCFKCCSVQPIVF